MKVLDTLIDEQLGYRRVPASYLQQHQCKQTRRHTAALQHEQFPGRKNREQYASHLINSKGLLHHLDLLGHYGCVNTIEFSNGEGRFLASGSDDRRVLIWDLFSSQKPKLVAELRGHANIVFCALFDSDNSHVVSSGNDEFIVRFDLEKRVATERAEFHQGAVHTVSLCPDNNMVGLSASEDGCIALFDFRTQGYLQGIQRPFSVIAPYLSVQFHPWNANQYVEGDAQGTVSLWDLRTSIIPCTQISTSARVFRMLARSASSSSAAGSAESHGCVPLRSYYHRAYSPQRYGSRKSSQSSTEVMSVSFNKKGDRILCLRKKHVPVLFHVDNSSPLAVFDSPSYRTSTTVKSAAFGGANDEFVLSGSDNFGVYVWAREDKEHGLTSPDILDQPSGFGVPFVCHETHVAHGHHSIVNNVRAHPSLPIIASAGVEKLIRLWSAIPLSNEEEEPLTPRTPLPINQLRNNPEFVYESGSSSGFNTAESPKTIQLFDFLVQVDSGSDDEIRMELDNSDDDENSDDDDDDDDDDDRVRGFMDDDDSDVEFQHQPSADEDEGTEGLSIVPYLE
mmetsp:Transcript_21605/g.37201  ORF Transcript_21605/g.37201 Transcript_21605/m.37201 type:complete len:564 (+) Transcript_21605:85-1776(+)